MFWFVVLLLVVGAGFYFYQKMMTIEREIRAEQEIEKERIQESQPVVEDSEEIPSTTIFDSENSPAPAAPEAEETITLEGAIFAEVTRQPGMKQSDIYLLVPDYSKKYLQKVLKALSDDGKIRREKQGSSYLLFPAE